MQWPKEIPVVIGGPETPVNTSQQPLASLDMMLAVSRQDRMLRRRVEQALKPFKLGIMSWLALGLVARQEDAGITSQQLAQELGITAPQASVITNGLAKMLVIKQRTRREDYRVKAFVASARGRTLADDANMAVQRALETLLKPIPDNYLTIYQKVITALGSRS